MEHLQKLIESKQKSTENTNPTEHFFDECLTSKKHSKKEKIFIRKYKPWGVILFTRNIKNIKQSLKLTSSIRRIFNDKKYPILIDQEGGKVNRLNKIIDLSFFSQDYFAKLFLFFAI